MASSSDIQDLQSAASSFMDSGQLMKAKEAYQRLCELDSENPEPWLMLGALCGELGSINESISHIGTSIRINPDYADAHLTLGHVLRSIGKNDEALESFKSAARSDPEFADAHFAVGKMLLEKGIHPESLEYFQRAIDAGGNEPELWKLTAWLLNKSGKLMDAEMSYRRSLELDNGDAETHFGLAATLQAQGRWSDALESLQNTVNIRPNYAEAYFSMAIVLQENVSINAAVECYEKAIGIRPGYEEAHAYLGLILLKQGKFEAAIKHCRAALDTNPENWSALYGLGRAYQGLGNSDDALDCYKKAQRLRETDSCLINMATVLPVILDSKSQIKETRDNFDRHLSELLLKEIHINDPLQEIDNVNTFLAYHGENDIDLQRKMADVYLKFTPSIAYISPSSLIQKDKSHTTGKISIGFISAFFSDHTIGEVMKGMIANLSRKEFDVSVITIRQPSDTNSAFIREASDHYIEIPTNLNAARKIIAEQDLDVLFYTDIGLDPFTYYLAFSRLAPVQCTTWGHPVTTGIPTMDYYISSSLFEPEGAQQHYTETLVLLENLPTFYYQPQDPPYYSRDSLKIPQDKNIYLCPQTLFKIHPEFDEYIGGILRGDRNGVVILVESRHDYWLELLLKRFKRTIGDVADRIVVLPYLGSDNYKCLLKSADVILDTLHYGGGSTSLQSLAYGTPIVTQPGTLQRGRHTYGYYRKMHYLECVTFDRDQYIKKAVHIGTDRSYREEISKEILARNHVLYESQEFIDELGQFFQNAVYQ